MVSDYSRFIRKNMFNLATLHSSQTAAQPAVVGGLRAVAWDDLRTGACAKQGFRHFPNLPEFGSEA
jgi:hypothetical protein